MLQHSAFQAESSHCTVSFCLLELQIAEHTFVIDNVSCLLEVKRVDHFVISVFFVTVEIFRLSTVTRAYLSAMSPSRRR